MSADFGPANLDVPFSNLFSVWSFRFDDHYKGLDKNACLKFVGTVDTKIAPERRSTPADAQNLRKAMIFLMNNAAHFTIAEFIHCLFPNHLLFGEIMMMVHKDKFNQALGQAYQAMQNADAAKNKNLADYEQLHAMGENNEAYLQQERSKIEERNFELNAFEQKLRNIQQEQIKNKNEIDNFIANNHSRLNPALNPLNSTGVFPPANNDLKDILLEIKDHMIVSKKAPPAGNAITKGIRTEPPTFNPKIHLSLRSYGQREFRMWAGTQNLNDRESTIFLYLAFREKRIHKNHVHTLAADEHGNPCFDKVNDLISEIVKQLRYSDEASDRLMRRFDEIIKMQPNVDLEEEFQRIFEIRQMGWPFDEELANVEAAKQKFILAINHQSKLQTFLYHERRDPKWTDAQTFFQVVAFLRELEFGHKNTPVSLNSQKPTNDPDAMQCNNCALGNCDVHKQTSSPQKQVNNIAERTCRNNECKKYSPLEGYILFAVPENAILLGKKVKVKMVAALQPLPIMQVQARTRSLQRKLQTPKPPLQISRRTTSTRKR